MISHQAVSRIGDSYIDDLAILYMWSYACINYANI